MLNRLVTGLELALLFIYNDQMSLLITLFHHLIDPLLIVLSFGAGWFVAGLKMRLIAAFTIGLIIELIFVSRYEGQDVSLFTLLIGAVAAYMWLVVGVRLKGFTLRRENKS